MKLTKAQQEFVELQKKHKPIKLIPWGLNYYRIMNEKLEYIPGKIRFETIDAIVAKGLWNNDKQPANEINLETILETPKNDE